MPSEAETTAAEPAASPSTAIDDGFAAELGGTENGELDAPEGATASAPQQQKFDPATVDWYRTPAEQIPEAYRPYQKQLKSALAEQTRASQRAAELERQVAELRQGAANQQEERLTRAVEKLVPQQDPYQDLRSKLDPDDVGAIDVVREIVRREAANQQSQGDPALQQQVVQLSQAMNAMVQYIQQQELRSQADDLKAAIATHGQEYLESIAPNLRALIQTVNPATGKAFTVSEAADLFRGVPAAKASAARALDRDVRTTAKRQAASTSGVTAGQDSPKTKDELLDALAGLGFKR